MLIGLALSLSTKRTLSKLRHASKNRHTTPTSHTGNTTISKSDITSIEVFKGGEKGHVTHSVPKAPTIKVLLT